MKKTQLTFYFISLIIVLQAKYQCKNDTNTSKHLRDTYNSQA